MIYADEKDARLVAGVGAWAEADAEMLEWGMGSFIAPFSPPPGWKPPGLQRVPPGLKRKAPRGYRWVQTRSGWRLVRVSAASRPSMRPILAVKPIMPPTVKPPPPAWGHIMARRRRRAILASRGVSQYEGGSEMGYGQESYGVSGLWETLGLKSPFSKDEARGFTLPQIFASYSGDVDRYARIVPRIPGAGQKALAKELATVQRMRDSLRPAFAPGTVQGKRDRDNLGNFVGAVKTFRSHLRNAMAYAGIRAELLPPEGTAAAKPPGAPTGAGVEAAVGLPILPLAIAALAAKLLGVF
jgi:hypothetical protein